MRDLHVPHLTGVLASAETRSRQGTDALADALLFDSQRAHFEAAQAWVLTAPPDSSVPEAPRLREAIPG